MEISNPSKPKVRKFKKSVKVVLLITAIAVIVIAALLIKKPQTAQTELLNITYRIELENGTLLDSGQGSFALNTIASSLGFKTAKLDSELAEMAEGETKRITLEANDAYGSYDSAKVYSYERVKKESRINEINRTIQITTEIFKQTFDEQPLVSKTYSLPSEPWPYKVLERNESHVKLSIEAKLGQELPGFFISKVIEITENKIKIKVEGNDTVIPTPSGNVEIKFTEDSIITTLTPQIGQEVQLPDLPRARVIEMNATHLTLDANHPYAGQKIIVTVQLISRKKVKEEGITGFVTCLEKAGFRIYGANWCGWTNRLVEQFGGYDVVRPIYIECTEQQALCNEKGIDGYPTILINDKPFTGRRTFEEFARATGCKVPADFAPERNRDKEKAPEGSC